MKKIGKIIVIALLATLLAGCSNRMDNTMNGTDTGTSATTSKNDATNDDIFETNQSHTESNWSGESESYRQECAEQELQNPGGF